MSTWSDGRRGVGREDRDEPVAQLVHVEHRRVDDDVGAALQLLEQRALLLDALEQALGVGERVGRRDASNRRTSASSDASRNSTRVRAPMRAQLGERLVEIVDERAGADVDAEAVALRAAAAAGELGDLADERRRQVVDDEEPEVLEHVGRRRRVRRRTCR